MFNIFCYNQGHTGVYDCSFPSSGQIMETWWGLGLNQIPYDQFKFTKVSYFFDD